VSTPPNSHPTPIALRERLAATRLADRPRLMRELERLVRRGARGGARQWVGLTRAIEASAQRVEALRRLPLNLATDPELPISAHAGEIGAALERHAVIIVCGATGSGKSTQLPKLALAAGRGALGLIGHTQPRRIAARALASRIAEELGTSVGSAVGYQVRFTDRTGPDCRVKLMTDGILLRELAGDRDLRRYDTLIIDEAHERSLNIDLLLGTLKHLSPRRPELKVIITSATIDPQKLAAFFGGAPVIEVSGRSYPVELRYRPLGAEDEDAAELSLPEGVAEAVRELVRGPQASSGDVLVFLPGERQIRECAEVLERAALGELEVLPLYARLASEDQQRIFESHGRRRIVLATNVAETSLTVPGIRCVIDSGLARLSRYSVRGKVQRLPIEPISRASAAQRAGRCGREAAGVCIRLYSQESFEAREEFTPPEVLRTNLASVILQMGAAGLGSPESFPFPDPPDMRLVNDGVRLLQELKAMDEERRVTSLGRQLAALPCDPRLARILVAAARHACLAEMLVIAAFLEGQDPRERPVERQQQADETHAREADARSDFLTVLALWRRFGEQAAMLSGRELRRWCRDQFLSFVRLREWQALQAELTESAAELGLAPSTTPASYKALHQALLTGFLGSIGALEAPRSREYVGARALRFVIAPGTPLATRPPGWVVAASLTETTRVYARMVAAVEPAWIEAAGEHLVRRSFSEPYWDRARGTVLAYESVALYGLPLAAHRRISYAAVAPREAHEIFLREALVAGESELPAKYLESNRRLVTEIERCEAKIRRRDVLIDEAHQVELYRARIPEHVSSVAAFESWWRATAAHEPQRLTLTATELMRRTVPELHGDAFPDQLPLGENRLPLHYVFEPGAADDGVTLLVPEPLYEELDAEQLAWFIPGARHEKLAALLRELPKAVRKQLVPVPEHARAALAELEQRSGARSATPLPPFHAWLSDWITTRTGESISAAALAALPLPGHLRFNIRVLPAADFPAGATVLAEGRDVQAIKQQLRAREARAPAHAAPAAAPLHRDWDFGELPESVELERAGVRLRLYPALLDRGHGVARIEAANAAEALASTRAGIARLARLALTDQARYWVKRCAEDLELTLLAVGLPLVQPLAEGLCDRAFTDCFASPELPIPRSRAAFEALLAARRAELPATFEHTIERLRAILRESRAVRTALSGLETPVFAAAVTDVRSQLALLMPPDFIRSTPEPWLSQLPRYLKAIARRLARLAGNVDRDAELARRVQPFTQAYRNLAGQPLPPAARVELEQLRWMIEELRVSLNAQDLKTLLPVSEKRLGEQLQRAREAAAR